MLDAVQCARSLAPDRLLAASVIADPEEEQALVDAWAVHQIPIPLHTIASPYRDLTGDELDDLDELDAVDIDGVEPVAARAGS